MDFNEYKLGVKIGKAKELLKNTGLTVEQIAYKLGYLNAESFIRIFKKFTKKTPTELRKEDFISKNTKKCRKTKKLK